MVPVEWAQELSLLQDDLPPSDRCVALPLFPFYTAAYPVFL